MGRPDSINKERFYDVIIVGGGPAGLTAALYLARARYRVLVMEKDHFGGQITITSEIVNYPGVHKTSGKELTETIRKQAQDFGAEFVLTEVERLSIEEEIKVVHTSRGDYQCFGVLLATGAHPRTVGFKGEEENKGRGVAYCATCDGEFSPVKMFSSLVVALQPQKKVFFLQNLHARLRFWYGKKISPVQNP